MKKYITWSLIIIILGAISSIIVRFLDYEVANLSISQVEPGSSMVAREIIKTDYNSFPIIGTFLFLGITWSIYFLNLYRSKHLQKT